MVNELVGVIRENGAGEGISNVLAKSYKSARSFLGFRRKQSFIMPEVDPFTPMEQWEDADVLGNTSEFNQWHGIVK